MRLSDAPFLIHGGFVFGLLIVLHRLVLGLIGRLLEAGFVIFAWLGVDWIGEFGGDCGRSVVRRS